MDAKSQAELEIISAADRWVREIMRSDRSVLTPSEQALLDAVLNYQRVLKSIDLQDYVDIPKPPKVPKDLIKHAPSPVDDEFKDTVRYSEYPTTPSLHRVIPAVNPDHLKDDIDRKW